MYDVFKNEPNCSLSGRTFDTQHLDKFLTTGHGFKLAVELFPGYKKPQTGTQNLDVKPRTILTNIRPSTNFISIGRETAVNTFEKNNLITFQELKYPQKQTQKPKSVRDKLKEVVNKGLGLRQEATFSMPSARRQELALAQKKLRTYAQLKDARRYEVKLNRIMKNVYPKGALNYDNPLHGQNSVFYKQQAKELNYIQQQIDEINSKRKDQNRQLWKTNSEIEFSNPLCTSDVKQNKFAPNWNQKGRAHSQNLSTYNRLFLDQREDFIWKKERAQYLKRQECKSRDYDIISGKVDV